MCPGKKRCEIVKVFVVLGESEMKGFNFDIKLT